MIGPSPYLVPTTALHVEINFCYSRRLTALNCYLSRPILCKTRPLQDDGTRLMIDSTDSRFLK